MLSAMAPHGREMSQDLRISLLKKGEGYKKISKALLISQNTVAKVVQTFIKDGTVTTSQRRPGHPRKLTPLKRLLMRRVEENRHASSLPNWGDYFPWHIRHTAEEWHAWVHPRKKPLLKPRHKKARLEFARAHADKDEDYWDSILWSDETKINVFGTDGFKTVWRRKGEEYKENAWCLQWNMVVAVSLCGAAWVLLVSGSCISLMASWIHKCTALYWKRRCYHHSVGHRSLFQHDNDPKHTSKATVGFLKKNRVSDSVAKYVSWSEPNRTPMGNSEETSWASLSIQHPISKRGHSWRMEKDESGKMSPTCSFHA